MSHYELSNRSEVKRGLDRRAEGRRRTLLTGKILYPHNSLSADCTIKDISSSGARIVVSTEASFSDAFLIIVKEAAVHQTKLAWARGNQVGLQFEHRFGLTGEVPVHIRHIRRVWLELMPR